MAVVYAQEQRTLDDSYQGDKPEVTGHCPNMEYQDRTYEVVILSVETRLGEMIPDLYFYLPVEASQLRLHFDPTRRTWVLVDEERHLAYFENTMPHDPCYEKRRYRI